MTVGDCRGWETVIHCEDNIPFTIFTLTGTKISGRNLPAWENAAVYTIGVGGMGTSPCLLVSINKQVVSVVNWLYN